MFPLTGTSTSVMMKCLLHVCIYVVKREKKKCFSEDEFIIKSSAGKRSYFLGDTVYRARDFRNYAIIMELNTLCLLNELSVFFEFI